MPLVGFEPTISAFELAKTGLALDGAATVIGNCILYITIFQCLQHSLFLFWKTACSYELFRRETVSTVRSSTVLYLSLSHEIRESKLNRGQTTYLTNIKHGKLLLHERLYMLIFTFNYSQSFSFSSFPFIEVFPNFKCKFKSESTRHNNSKHSRTLTQI
jgi:hypothetical protein